jgi:hypothetical protein
VVRASAVFLAASLVLCSRADAQLQVGGQYSVLNLGYPDQTRSGVGAFFVYSPRDWIGADVSTTLFVEEPIGGTAWQLLAGPRAGVGAGRVAVYGRVRPGLVRFSERVFVPDLVCSLIYPPVEACLAPRTNFALDLGGTIEAGLVDSAVLRVDLGDMLVRWRRPAQSPRWKHGFQFAAGVGWRF